MATLALLQVAVRLGLLLRVQVQKIPQVLQARQAVGYDPAWLYKTNLGK